jgi:hypothetical protein
MSNRNKLDVELPDDESNIEEAHDMKNAEEQSITATDKAAKSTKQAPQLKGSKTNQEPMQKLKKVSEMELNFGDDLEALIENEATLSDEFKAKTAVIFETAVRTKLSEELERLEEEYQDRLEEELDASRSDLVEKVDSYLNYVVENWMQENKLAVETGLRTEIAETFMSQLKNLFVESYIEIPESKVDLVDELAEMVESLESRVNEQTSDLMLMSEVLEQYQRDAVIREASRDLAETQVAKLHSLVESLEFGDVDMFAQKVKTVKESYFKKRIIKEQENDDNWDDEASTKEVSSSMNVYLSALKKTNK